MEINPNKVISSFKTRLHRGYKILVSGINNSVELLYEILSHSLNNKKKVLHSSVK